MPNTLRLHAVQTGPLNRRSFLRNAAMTMAATHLGMTTHAIAEPKPPYLPTVKPETNTAFASLKQIDAGVLNIGYSEVGAPDGQAVILLHGWRPDPNR